ncbi:hypothetical protein HDU93_000303 [Gonapodya sp. JEL0774]|nr:hypothetical protein HDU93_000303 [Gonapodya sp. JEL0774]
MFAGDFDSGRILAQQRTKWILINIQDPTEFQCQVLNRDLWSNTAVKDAIKEHFLFMQFGSRSQERQKYVNLYKAYRYPHVAIIDPGTGERSLYEKTFHCIKSRRFQQGKKSQNSNAFPDPWILSRSVSFVLAKMDGLQNGLVLAVYDFADRNSLTHFKNKKLRQNRK